MTLKQATQEIKKRNLEYVLAQTLKCNPTKTTRQVLEALLGKEVIDKKGAKKC